MLYSIENFFQKRQQVKRAMKCSCADEGKVGHERDQHNWVCNNCGNIKKAGK